MKLVFLLGLWRLDAPESATEGGAGYPVQNHGGQLPSLLSDCSLDLALRPNFDMAHHGVGFLPFGLWATGRSGWMRRRAV